LNVGELLAQLLGNEAAAQLFIDLNERVGQH
jgi:hypothetical protein